MNSEIQAIRMWHGESARLIAKLDQIATRVTDGSGIYWLYDGTLNDFAKAYGGHFLAYPDDPNGWNIFVTQHSGFGQR